MPIDSSLIGKTSDPQTFVITREAVLRFMEATEDPALQSGQSLEYAPPTFPTTFRFRSSALELDATTMQLIHGEQTYDYTRRLRIGDEVTCVSRIADIRERVGRSGPMTIVTSEIHGTLADNQPAFTARSILIVRMK